MRKNHTNKNLVYFEYARLGMFIHYGPYSIIGGEWKGKSIPYIGEWIQHGEKISMMEYEREATRLNCTLENIQQWVSVAIDSGFKYIVFTAKHHDGFALWNSRCDKFNVKNFSPSGIDVIKELSAECRRRGIKLGLYYSHCIDWHEPHGGNQPENIKEKDDLNCKYEDSRVWGNDWDFDKGNANGFDLYLREKVEPQIRELLTLYGDIFTIWFDTPMRCLKKEQAERLVALVKGCQPECLVGGRIGHGLQDFDCLGDNEVPVADVSKPSESCMTLNKTWGYKRMDRSWSNSAEVIDLLSACVSRGCNLLLNIGPRGNGNIPTRAIKCLGEVGQWLKKNGESIYGAGPSGLNFDSDGYHITKSPGSYFAILAPRGNKIKYIPRLGHIGAVEDHDCDRIERAGIKWLRLVGQDAHSHKVPKVVSMRASSRSERLKINYPLEDPNGTIFLSRRTAIEIPKATSNDYGAVVEWRFICHYSGKYNVIVYSGGDRYREWNGCCDINLTINKEAIHRGRLKGEITLKGRRYYYYPVRGSQIGMLQLKQGINEIELSVGNQSGIDSVNAYCIILQRES